MTKPNKAARIYENVNHSFDVVLVGIEPIYTTFDAVEARHYAESIAEYVTVRLLDRPAFTIESL